MAPLDGASSATTTGAAPAAPCTGTDVHATQYRALMLRRLTRLIGAGAVLGALIVADILTGPAMLGLNEVLTGLFTPAKAEPMIRVIVQDIRLPMSLMAILVGMSGQLNACGVVGLSRILWNSISTLG